MEKDVLSNNDAGKTRYPFGKKKLTLTLYTSYKKYNNNINSSTAINKQP